MAPSCQCSFSRNPQNSLEFLSSFAGQVGIGEGQGAAVLQESRNESHTRQMSWELTGNLLLATWPRGQLQLGRNYSQPEKHSGMLVVIF